MATVGAQAPLGLTRSRPSRRSFGSCPPSRGGPTKAPRDGGSGRGAATAAALPPANEVAGFIVGVRVSSRLAPWLKGDSPTLPSRLYTRVCRRVALVVGVV